MKFSRDHGRISINFKSGNTLQLLYPKVFKNHESVGIVAPTQILYRPKKSWPHSFLKIEYIVWMWAISITMMGFGIGWASKYSENPLRDKKYDDLPITQKGAQQG